MKKDFTILVVDDEEGIRTVLQTVLGREGYRVDLARQGQEALERFTTFRYDLVISDLMMPAMNGLDLLKKIKEIAPETIVILMTGYSDIEQAVAAMKSGAEDYLTKPVQSIEISKTVEQFYRTWHLSRETDKLKQEVMRHEIPEIVGKSEAVKKVFADIRSVADHDVPVLITGETGTGKELVARAIHSLSGRRKEPFIAINCSAVPRDLLESEFYGYERGAFSGALNRKFGLFEIADRGTLFLDEIAEMPMDLQSKLLRVIETGRLRRLGGTDEVEIDTRIISATNRNIKEEISAKPGRAGRQRFRPDLYYRLNTYTIEVPSLRERLDDIPLLVNHYLKSKGITDPAADRIIAAFQAYTWPGNVRELQNVIEQMLLRGSRIFSVDHLPYELRQEYKSRHTFTVPDPSVPRTIRDLEKDHIEKMFTLHNRDKQKTAEALDIGVATLYRKIKEFSIQ